MTTFKSPTSVTHFLWSGNIGGIERLVGDLSEAQAGEGLDVKVVFGSDGGLLGREMRAAGTETVDLGFKRGYVSSRGRITKAAVHLAAADIVHLHGYNFVFEATVRASGRPVLFTEHGNFGHARRPTIGGRVKAWRKARFLRSLPAIAANSEYSAARLGDLYRIDRRAVSVVYNGVAIDSPAVGAGYSPSPRVLSIAFIGRLVDWKRPGSLIEALRLVADPHRFRVQIVGSGPLETELRSRVVAYGLSDIVRFVGESLDVTSVLDSADVLVSTSEGEPFGLVILEATLAGALPVVFADGGGALEVIPPDGIVVHDVRDLARTLDELIGSPAIDANSRLTRSSWARETFPISRTSRAYLSLYEFALARPRDSFLGYALQESA
ncbi:glycosyltransferase family 4 protein [soil metagenome]